MYRLRIDRLFHKNAIGIWIIRDNGRMQEIAAPMEMKFVEPPNEFMLPEPSLEISGANAIQFLSAFVEALEEQSWIKSKLSADSNAPYKENLADLRKITDRLLNIVEAK